MLFDGSSVESTLRANEVGILVGVSPIIRSITAEETVLLRILALREFIIDAYSNRPARSVQIVHLTFCYKDGEQLKTIYIPHAMDTRKTSYLGNSWSQHTPATNRVR